MQGSSTREQLQLIIEKLGVPPQDEMTGASASRPLSVHPLWNVGRALQQGPHLLQLRLHLASFPSVVRHPCCQLAHEALPSGQSAGLCLHPRQRPSDHFYALLLPRLSVRRRAGITNRAVIETIRKMGEGKTVPPLAEQFAGASPMALDLLNRMLTFDQIKRCTVDVSGNPRAVACCFQSRALLSD